jgi:hypothetical protein
MSLKRESPNDLRRRYARHRSTLSPDLDKPQQLLGYAAVGCGATHGILERCNFACTSCYLTDIANDVEPLPFEAVAGQLDAIRAHLGEAGKVQITSGEVTLLNVDDLGRIIAYARGIGLDPVVMPNGHRFVQRPDYFPTLVKRYGLQKVSFHIDTTQKGRPGLRSDAAEADINPFRDTFADMVRKTRKVTGAILHAAQTVTVTPTNIRDIPEIVTWAIQNADAIRILSFLPAASVGRTLDGDTATADLVWDGICKGIGRPINRRAMLFGHPACNTTVPLLLFRAGDRITVEEVARTGRRWDKRIFKSCFENSAIISTRGSEPSRIFIRALPAALLRPHRIAELILYVGYRAFSTRDSLARVLTSAISGRGASIDPLLIVIHAFMGENELNTPLGRERLEACVFKLPVGDEMVSMCEMNATGLRRQINEQHLPSDHSTTSHTV